MTERVALITGGARGIGRALARSLAADGWSVAFCWRNSADDAAALAEQLRARYPIQHLHFELIVAQVVWYHDFFEKTAKKLFVMACEFDVSTAAQKLG